MASIAQSLRGIWKQKCHSAPAESIQKRFSVCYVAPSRAIFEPGCQIRLIQVALPGGTADVELSTRYTDGWGPVEDALVMDTSGSADEPACAHGSLAPILSDVAAVLSLTANAWVGEPAPVKPLQDGVTPDVAVFHKLDETVSGVLLERIAHHPEVARLRQIANCYRRALAFAPEAQPLALTELHRGLTLMSEVMIRHLGENRGLPRAGVARMFGVTEPDLPARILESELYRDDVVCLHAAQLAGMPDADSYVVDDAHLSAARYLRSAIFRVLELSASHHAHLMAPPYDAPLGFDGACALEAPERERTLSVRAARPRAAFARESS